MSWRRASEYCQDILQGAILEKTMFGIDCQGTRKCKYDLTICKREGFYIPIHGMALMPARKLLREAKADLISWFNDEQKRQEVILNVRSIR